MNCPACLSLMTNGDEIHKISPTKNRMNLHCNNHNECPARKMRLNYSPYMQVIINGSDPWECVNYGLIIIKNNHPILLQGDFGCDFTAAKITDTVDEVSLCSTNFVSPIIFQKPVWKDVRRIKFIQLSTGNDMHIQAIELVNKLTKLIAFI